MMTLKKVLVIADAKDLDTLKSLSGYGVETQPVDPDSFVEQDSPFYAGEADAALIDLKYSRAIGGRAATHVLRRAFRRE